MIKSFFDNLNISYEENASLKKYNSYRIDATCSYLAFPKNVDELIKILREIKNNNLKYIILGNGSNIILSKDNYDYIFIKLDNLNCIEYSGNTITVDAGYSLIKLALETAKKGLSGLTFAAGIPGNVGASTAMNAGAYNSDMSSIVKSVKVLNEKLEIVNMSVNELDYSYRDSFLKHNKDYIVLSTTFELQYGDTTSMINQINERRIKRMATQPLNMPSAGSVFRNPKDMYAGELIEKLNFKGYQIGGAKVSEIHANFIVNNGNATGEDIVTLINKIREEVKQNYNVLLKLEQIIIE